MIVEVVGTTVGLSRELAEAVIVESAAVDQKEPGPASASTSDDPPAEDG